MPSQKLLDLKAELLAAKAELVPQIEGLHDFARLNLHEDTQQRIQEATREYERRLGLIDTTLETLNNLSGDNYPEMPIREVLHDVFSDLQDNVNTIQAAFGKFAAKDEAVSALVTVGTPQPKP